MDRVLVILKFTHTSAACFCAVRLSRKKPGNPFSVASAMATIDPRIINNKVKMNLFTMLDIHRLSHIH